MLKKRFSCRIYRPAPRAVPILTHRAVITIYIDDFKNSFKLKPLTKYHVAPTHN